jgi:hypothetical protein
MKRLIGLSLPVLALTLFAALPAHCFPAYQEFVEKHSGRNVNCAMCHRSDDGPTGNGPGQVGSLSPDEMNQLNKARVALEPGSTVDNPILNKFGNAIVHQIGIKKVLELSTDPAKLPEALGSKSDLDGDGIADAQEFLDGTDPLNMYHGDPVKLLFINLDRSKYSLLLAAIAVFLLGYGLTNLLKGISAVAKANEPK